MLDGVIRFLRRRRFLVIWAGGMASTVLVLVAALSPYSPLDRLNALVFDTYQNFKPRPSAESPVVVVDIDDASIAALGQWPWPRTTIASLVDRLGAMGAAVVGFDVIFSEPDRTSPALALDQLKRLGFTVAEPTSMAELDHDAILAKSLEAAPVVVGLAMAETTRTPPPKPKAGFSFGGADPKSYLADYGGSVRNLQPLDEAATGIGVISFPPGRDGIVRSIPLVSRYKNALYPALSIELLRVAQGASTFLIRSTGAHGEADTGSPGMIAVKDGALEVPTGSDGSVWIYYADKEAAPIVSANRVLMDSGQPELADLVAGKIVLIGTSAIGLRDIVSTPLRAGVPGVMVHAEIIDQIVSGTFLSRPDWAPGAEIFAAVALTIVVLAFLPWFPTFSNALVSVNAIAVSIAGAWAAFAAYNLILSPVLPAQCALLAYGVGSGIRLLLSEREKRFIRQAFSHYLAPSMIQQLMDNPKNLVLGGEDREITLLFMDIRGFTGISERLGPVELTHFLNDFLTPMTEVLLASGATIDKYMGDAIMAFWNAPVAVADHRMRARESVVRMEAAVKMFNQTQPEPIAIGIGLNTGVCCVGNLGSRQRFDYSAIGDPVNIASRAEGMSKQYGLSNLVSESTAEGASEEALLEVDRVQLYGKAKPTSIFTVVGDRSMASTPAFADLKARHDRFLSAYRGRAFDEAAAGVAELCATAPENLRKLYEMFRRRVDALRQAPPPDHWDGVFRAESK